MISTSLVIFFQTTAIYLFLIVALRLVGLRQLSQLTSIDLLILVLLGSAVETSMIAADVSLPAGLISAASLLAVNYLLTLCARRSKHLRYLVCGRPMLIVHNGQIIQEYAKRAGLTDEDILEALREREVDDLSEVRFAVLEPDGQIHVIRRNHSQQPHKPTPERPTPDTRTPEHPNTRTTAPSPR